MKKLFLVLLPLLAIPLAVFAAGSKEAAGAKPGGSVSVLATWGGDELTLFNSMVKPYTDATGTKVEYEGTRDLDAVLTTRVAAGNPPDVAGLPGPGKMAEFARAGKLVDLSGVLDMAETRKSYAQGWLDLGTVDGKLSGIFMKASLKGLIWYNPKKLKAAGLSPATTWDQLMRDSRSLADKGTTPWAIGVESGSASGWAGTDWLEDIFLKMHGPDLYKQLYEGKLAWTSPQCKAVWQEWGKIIADAGMIYGGNQYVNSTNFGTAFTPVFQDPPRAYYHHQATFIQSFIQQAFPDLKPVEDFDFFGFPSIDQRYAKSVEIAGDLAGMFRNTPQAAALMKYFTTAQAQAYWVKAANGISPNRNVSLSDYPDPLSRNAAQILTSADMTVFDASDMMPGKMNTAFWSAVVDYIADPDRLDGILADLDKVRLDAYGGK